MILVIFELYCLLPISGDFSIPVEPIYLNEFIYTVGEGKNELATLGTVP